jgi:hypothetical protein
MEMFSQRPQAHRRPMGFIPPEQFTVESCPLILRRDGDENEENDNENTEDEEMTELEEEDEDDEE